MGRAKSVLCGAEGAWLHNPFSRGHSSAIIKNFWQAANSKNFLLPDSKLVTVEPSCVEWEGEAAQKGEGAERSAARLNSGDLQETLQAD